MTSDQYGVTLNCFNCLRRKKSRRAQEDHSRTQNENYLQTGLEVESEIAEDDRIQSALDKLVLRIQNDPIETPAWCEHDQEVLKMHIQQDWEVPTDQLHLPVYSDLEMSRAQGQNYVNENASLNQHHFHETAAQIQPDLEKIERNIHNVTKTTADKLQQDLKEFNSKIQGQLDKMVFKMMWCPPARQETILHNLRREHENILGCLADLVTRVQHNLDKTAAKVQSGLDNVVPWVQNDPKETPAWCEHDQEVLKMHIQQDLEVPTDQLQQDPTGATDHIQKDGQELVAELQFSQTELMQHNLDEEDGQSLLQIKTEMDKSTSHTLLDLHVPVDQFKHDQNELSNQIGGNPEFISDETGEKSNDEDEELLKTLSECGSNWEEQAAVIESELNTATTTSDCEQREETGSHISLDSFVFHKVLGRGTFGKVMLAELKESGKYYAIKTLKKGSTLAYGKMNDVRTERRVLMLATESPFLSHLHCAFQTKDNLCFVMEYINGGDLCFHIDEHGLFDLPSTEFYAAEIICALQFLHRNGVIYRDLKLENTMLDRDGHIKLVDFGVSKDNMFGDSRTKTFCGTAQYIAPEIYLGCQYSTPVDWWAFGVLLFKLLTGDPPFSGEDVEEVSRSVLENTPEYPLWMNQNTKDLLGKLLEKDPDFRLGTYGNIREHPYFESMDWPRIERREVEPPFKPKLESPYDCSNFDKEFLDEIPELSQGDNWSNYSELIDESPFLNFSFTHPNFSSSSEN